MAANKKGKNSYVEATERDNKAKYAINMTQIAKLAKFANFYHVVLYAEI
jgi:stalled ribosome alternative rescue factor ArfA